MKYFLLNAGQECLYNTISVLSNRNELLGEPFKADLSKINNELIYKTRNNDHLVKNEAGHWVVSKIS